MMRVAPPERRDHRSIHDPVNVSLFECRVARVKFIVHNFTRQNPYVPADIAVNRRTQLRRRDLALNLDVRDLPFRVNTSIRSSRSMHVDAAAVDQRECVRQLTLNGPATFLNLPAMEVGPIVLKKQFVIHVQSSATKSTKGT